MTRVAFPGLYQNTSDQSNVLITAIRVLFCDKEITRQMSCSPNYIFPNTSSLLPKPVSTFFPIPDSLLPKPVSTFSQYQTPCTIIQLLMCLRPIVYMYTTSDHPRWTNSRWDQVANMLLRKTVKKWPPRLKNATTSSPLRN